MTRIKKDKFKSKADTDPVSKYYIGTATPMKYNQHLVSLAAGIKGAKKYIPGRKYKGTADFITKDYAEYLYLTNSYVARGVDTTSEAIVRNGFSVKANNASDQQYIDLILKENNFTSLLKDINAYIELYGQPMVEMFPDKKLKTTRFDILPPTEMDYLRDKSNNVLYTPEGEPRGYVQKRDGKDLNTWSGEDAKRIIVFKHRTLGGYIEGIPGIQTLLYAASEYGHIRSAISDSFIRSLPVCHITAIDASPGDIDEITNSVGKKFTAETVYVTSDRVTLKNEGPTNDIDVFKFVEPTLSDIAACFHMPIEMVAATEYLKGDDFNDRYAEWIEHVKMKQKILAGILERKVFNVLFPDGVVVKFNTPATVNTSELIKNVGFAKQSGAIDQELALEILARNQVFGPFSDDLLARFKTSEVSNNGMQKETKKEVNVQEDIKDDKDVQNV